MQNFAKRSNATSRKKSMDTRATDEKDGIILPDLDDDDSLIGELDNSLMGNSMNSQQSR